VSVFQPARLSSFEPCLPRAAKQPPAGVGWIHGIKHDGFRIMARRADGRVQLLTREGNDFSSRFPQIIAALTALPTRSCLVNGEAIVCNERGMRECLPITACPPSFGAALGADRIERTAACLSM
jgi:ATP-dependent DNA ligase